MSYKWKITGYNSTKLIFEFKVPFGNFTEKGMCRLLKALVAKHALTESEIISSYAKKNVKIYSPLLETHRSSKPYSLSCGTSLHVRATVVED